jgi:HEAT repeat protein
VPDLLLLFKDPEDKLRGYSGRALGLIRADTTKAIPALLVIMRDDVATVRLETAIALCRELPQDSEVEDRVSKDINELLSGGPRNRIRAASELRSIGAQARSAVPALLTALREGSNAVRADAISVLRCIGDTSPETVDAIIHSLNDTHRLVRARAASALGQIGRRPGQPSQH